MSFLTAIFFSISLCERFWETSVEEHGAAADLIR